MSSTGSSNGILSSPKRFLTCCRCKIVKIRFRSSQEHFCIRWSNDLTSQRTIGRGSSKQVTKAHARITFIFCSFPSRFCDAWSPDQINRAERLESKPTTRHIFILKATDLLIRTLMLIFYLLCKVATSNESVPEHNFREGHVGPSYLTRTATFELHKGKFRCLVQSWTATYD